MSRVERHEIGFVVDDEKRAYNLKRRAKIITFLERSPKSLSTYTESVYGVARQELTVDPSASQLETWEAWVFAMQITNAVFQLSEVEPGQEAVLRVGHEDRLIKVRERLSVPGPAAWERAFHLAVTCRDHDRARALCRIPVERLRESAVKGGSEYLEFTYQWIETLQAFVTGGAGLVDKLRRSMELCDPEAVPFGGENVALVAFPQLEVFHRLLMGDPEEFVKAMTRALEDFKRFYGSRDDDSGSHEGIVPLGLLSLACLGHDKFRQQDPEFTLGIDSEYLPEHIVKASWYGEFPI